MTLNVIIGSDAKRFEKNVVVVVKSTALRNRRTELELFRRTSRKFDRGTRAEVFITDRLFQPVVKQVEANE